MASEMVGRVARAIYETEEYGAREPWGSEIGEEREVCVAYAAAALRALREPTEAMVAHVCGRPDDFGGIAPAPYAVRHIVHLLVDAALAEGDVPPAA